jgi:YbbR domain-containing protein
VEYKNVPEEIALDPGLPQEMNLRIADKGTALLNYTLSGKMDAIQIDLKKIDPRKSSYSISGISLEKDIIKRLPLSTSLVGYTPERIELKYSALKEKTVPVRMAGFITAKAGFMFEDSVHLDPKEITVYGSGVALDTIYAVLTKPVEIKDLYADFEKKVELVFPEGITSDTKSVLLSGHVEGYTEKIFKLPVVCENVPDEYVVRLFPPTVDIICQVALSRYTSLSETDFKLYVDYNSLIDNTELSIPVEVFIRPQWLRYYRLSPGHVEFLIEKKSGL